MNKKSKSAAGKDKPKAKKLSIHKDTVQSLSDEDLGKAQGGRIAIGTKATCSNPCPPTKLLCPKATTVPAGCPSSVTTSGCGAIG